MADNIRMDSHKLIYHPETVARWMRGETIYPIEIEISPSGACNHRCVFCAVDYLGYEPNFLDKDTVLRDVRLAHEKGLKSVICSGEGEPLLNRQLLDMVMGMKEIGVDVAMSSNGALFTKDFAEECLRCFTWVRFSVVSLEDESYYSIQKAPKGDLEKVERNLADAVEVKRRQGLRTTLGVQCLLLDGNMAQLPEMARNLKAIGVDYLTVKPFSQHLHSGNRINMDYERLLDLEKELKGYETADFSIYFRANAMKKMHHEKAYKECLGLPFMTHIDAKGNVWPCVAHIGVDEFKYGNINENTFREIWEGERRKEVIERLYSMDINKTCREACRLDEINKYLDELKHPGEHVNFI
ncbi:MAG: radical SAM protein [Lachnospiraceae bacterium]|nr:radical SAM protein [Lachnospiraceae bacterium]